MITYNNRLIYNVDGRCGCDRIVNGFTSTCTISAYHSSNLVHGEVYSI